MYNFDKVVERELGKINYLIRKIEGRQIKTADGWLYCATGKDNSRYYLQKRMDKTGKMKNTFIGDETSQAVKEIKSGRFYSDTLKRLKVDRKLLEAMLKNYREYSPESVYGDMPRAYKDLSPECFTDQRYEELREWAEGEFESSGYEFTGSVSTTIDGKRVRSKGEVAIYNLLVLYKIPFRYEFKIILDDVDGTKIARYPDFTILLADGSLLYWEHAGAFDNDKYYRNFCQKLRAYFNTGITLGDNLIVTSDRKGHGMNTEVADAIIREYILPRVKTLA